MKNDPAGKYGLFDENNEVVDFDPTFFYSANGQFIRLGSAMEMRISKKPIPLPDSDWLGFHMFYSKISLLHNWSSVYVASYSYMVDLEFDFTRLKNVKDPVVYSIANLPFKSLENNKITLEISKTTPKEVSKEGWKTEWGEFITDLFLTIKTASGKMYKLRQEPISAIRIYNLHYNVRKGETL